MAEAPTIECDPEEARKMYTVMARLKALDDVFYNAQVCVCVCMCVCVWTIRVVQYRIVQYSE